MARHVTTASSTLTANPRRHMKRFGTAALAALFAFAIALALSLSGGHNALAQDVSGAADNGGLRAPSASSTTADTSGLITGQIPQSESVTVLVYMNGSDLESEAGEATADIAEMLGSGAGDNVKVVIETLGTRNWQDFGIASDHTQRYLVNQGKLELVDDSLGQLDTTSPDTLSDFISWGVANYPADRYILLFWDHGAGPVYGFGYDEFQSDYSALTLDEMQQALAVNSDVHFDIIGMDCCIMSSLETCYVLQPYCDYAILSEDFEPGIGWNYESWLRALEQNPSMNTAELGKVIVDGMIEAVEADRENGDATLALIDESVIGQLYTAWVDFAYASQTDLLGTNYSQETEWRDRPEGFAGRGKAHDWEEMWDYWNSDASYVTMTDYFVTDLLEVASSIDSDKAATLKTAADAAIAHFGSTSGEVGMSGIGVTLPYGDAEFYDELVDVFTACGIDKDYVSWLEAFVNAEGADNYYDYSHGLDDYYGYNLGANDDYSYGQGYDFEDAGSYYDNGYGHVFEDAGSNHDYGYDYGYDHGNSYGYGYGYENADGYSDYDYSLDGAGPGYPNGQSYGRNGFDEREFGSWEATRLHHPRKTPPHPFTCPFHVGCATMAE